MSFFASIQVSVNYIRDPLEAQHAKRGLVTFKSVQASTDAELFSILCSRPWAPVVFKDSKRRIANFLHADILGLDFDGGLRIEEVIRWLDELNYPGIIGTTKSHTTDTHRFRVILPWYETVTHAHSYRESIRTLARSLPGGLASVDPACFDPARFYWPCREIVHVRNAGYPVEWAYAEPPKYSTPPTLPVRKGYLPPFVKNLVRFGVAPGCGRNTELFKASKELIKVGYSDVEVEGVLSAARIDWQHPHPFTQEELKNVIRSARQNCDRSRNETQAPTSGEGGSRPGTQG